jgi:hypothetical protein
MINERGVDNLWELPVDGSKRRQLTTFEDDASASISAARHGMRSRAVAPCATSF